MIEFSENELMEIGITDANVKVIRNSDKEEITLNFIAFDSTSSLGIYTEFDLNNPFSFNPDFARFGESYKLQIICKTSPNFGRLAAIFAANSLATTVVSRYSDDWRTIN